MKFVTSVSESLKGIITLFLLVVAFPVGVLLMWKWVKWNIFVKIALTFLPLTILLLILLGAFKLGTMF